MRRTLVCALVCAMAAITVAAPAALSEPSGLRYPHSVKHQFVKGCLKGGGSRRACVCAIHGIERTYSFSQFLSIINRVNRTGEFPPKVRRIIRRCV